MRWLEGITDLMNLSRLWELVMDREAWCVVIHEVTKSRNNWVTELNFFIGRKAMANLDSILKSRDITLPTKGHLVKAIVFPVVMYDVRVGL